MDKHLVAWRSVDRGRACWLQDKERYTKDMLQHGNAMGNFLLNMELMDTLYQHNMK